MSNTEIEEKIENGEFTLYDKFLYGGIGYGYICMAKNSLRVILSVLFPPLGIILHHLNIKDTFPYITKDGLANLVENLHDVLFSVFLTFIFWVPGVIYSLKKMKSIKGEEQFDSGYGIYPDELTDNMVKDFMRDIKKRKKYSI